MEYVLITALGIGGATVIGAVLGMILRKIPHQWNDAILGFAAGVMLAAAVIGLVILVQIFQSLGTKLATACDKRLKNRS